MAAGHRRRVGQSGRRRRLSRSADFDRVFREGRSFATRHVVLHAFPRTGDEVNADPRLGVSVGRRVGGAVERNRVKRLLRESFWALAAEVPAEHDYVIVARVDAADLARDGGEPAFREQLRELVAQAAGGGS